jgi:anthranilate synthase component 1
MKINTRKKQIIADLTTPVSLYLKIREKYGEAHLLETSAYSVKEGSSSMICFNSLGRLSVSDGEMTVLKTVKNEFNIYDEIQNFISHFEVDHTDDSLQAIFGYTSYSAIQHFEQIKFDNNKIDEDIPDIRYDYYRNIIVFHHFHESLIVLDNCPDGAYSNI